MRPSSHLHADSLGYSGHKVREYPPVPTRWRLDSREQAHAGDDKALWYGIRCQSGVKRRGLALAFGAQLGKRGAKREGPCSSFRSSVRQEGGATALHKMKLSNVFYLLRTEILTNE